MLVDISNQISAIQNATNQAVTSIQEITTTITEVSKISVAISAAVEEQGAATQGVANISGVTESAAETGQSASQVLDASNELSKLAEQLGTDIGSFMLSVREQ